MDGRVVQVVVAAHHDVQNTVILDRSGDHHLGDALAKIRFQQFHGSEATAAFKHQVDPRLRPGDGTGFGMLGESDLATIDLKAITGDRDRPVEAPVHGVELEQVRRTLEAALGLVDVDQLEFGMAAEGTNQKSTNASETVDAESCRHDSRDGNGAVFRFDVRAPGARKEP